MSDKYILGGEDGHTVIAEDDLLKWARWFETANRIVKQEQIGPYFVSTVFLGLDHGFVPRGQPILFETMVFDEGASPKSIDGRRCSTWDESLAQHEEVAAKYRLLISN